MDHNHLTIKTFMAITAERDAAIRERNMALEERKRAFAERDMAMLERDAAIAECNCARQQRDEAIVALQIQIASETANTRKLRQPKEGKITKSVKSPSLFKGRAEGMIKPLTPASSNRWNAGNDLESEEELEKQPATCKDNFGLNQINFDESSMPVPVCSCTGTPQPCYKWGNGGWQSACCTMAMSMYPLPQVSNKRYTRVGGRKMSASAFSKLLNRLAAEGHDLYSAPLDLKDYWAKHGTNRYSTLK